jgi:hypothetical protein
MNYFDPIRKDFQMKPTGLQGLAIRGINWFRNKINKPPMRLGGAYNPRTGEATAFLNNFKALMDNPEVSEERVVELISDILTHEYLHKIISEDPNFIREWIDWKNNNSNNSIHARMKESNAQELIAYGMMAEEIRALQGMANHFSVDGDIREAAAKVVKELIEKSKDSDLRATQWARENGINPRLKMWEFLEAANKATSVNVRKFDSLHSGAIQQGLVPASDDTWFNILRMGEAVTSSASGTSALFNNKSIGGKKRGKRKKTSKERQRNTNKTT